MTTLIATAITAFVISFLLIPVIIKYSQEKNLMDIPGRRKIHKKLTPSLGGIAIFIGFGIASLIWIEPNMWAEIRYVLIAQAMIFFIGIRDDIVPLPPFTKLAGQIIAATILISLMDLRLRSFHGILGIHELPLWVSYTFTIFTIIVITNSFNLIDGLDGLAGLLAIISFLALGTWYFLAGDRAFAALAFSMIGAVIGFLYFNWEPSKIFMGDTGALVIGITLAIFVIRFIDAHVTMPVEHTVRFASAASAGVGVLMIPLADTLRVFIIRIFRGQSPFTADKSHIHHSLMRLGLSHSQAALLLGFLQLAFILLSIGLRNYANAIALPALVLPAVILSISLDWMLRRKVA
ncbi:MAG: undecaprenyl/decaprenyl-phosphate alpha-N-acetylglucosaminyl 1-phosphate transferase [Cyclobacteriaceae bacterium]|nr:undecaprenyl/decaprenyl-phosphate alpha-N-acetylglucosaminyl 1-phosphate transferase [Cyclobacteriaceae bacterium]